MNPSSKRNWPLTFGIGLLLVGTGPLVTIMTLAWLGFGDDPNPNPILFGMLAGLTFYPSIGLITWGIFQKIRQRKKKRN